MFGPLILLVGALIFFAYGRYRTHTLLSDADGLSWGSGSSGLRVTVDKTEEGELVHYHILVVDSERNVIFHRKQIVDRDMFGGGFVRAAQADRDPEPEVLVWTRGRDKYILDYKPPEVRQLSFDSAPKALKELAVRWHRFHVMAGFETAALIVLAVTYYLLYAVIRFFVAAFAKSQQRNENP
jgi:hypothetical protein